MDANREARFSSNFLDEVAAAGVEGAPSTGTREVGVDVSPLEAPELTNPFSAGNPEPAEDAQVRLGGGGTG